MQPGLPPPGPLRILAVDTETCALGPARDRIVQFCVEELDGDLEVLARWTQLVHPGRPIPAAATAIHGITDGMVRHAPRFGEVAGLLRALFRPGVVFMAYNAPFDLGVLDAEFVRSGEPPISGLPVIDPLRIERRVTSRSLGPTYRRYMGRDPEGAHTADGDVRAMVDVLRAQRARHADLLPAALADLVDWPAQEPRLRRKPHLWRDAEGTVRLGFGRHQGKAAREVPSYLAWMLEEDFPERTKRVAREILGECLNPGARGAGPP